MVTLFLLLCNLSIYKLTFYLNLSVKLITMKAELHFNLDDAEDSMEYTRCVKATNMALVLWELVHNSKRTLEWKMESDSINRYDALDMVFGRISELLEEHDINVDKLIN